MRKSLCCLLLAASFLGCGLSVNALERPTASQYDARVMYTDYKPGQVYPIRAANGLITTITFSPGEKIRDFGSGYSTAWEFQARGNNSFLKPKDFDGATNLVIVTDKHTYLFDVHPGSRAKATYSLTFRYPLEEAAKAQENANKKTVDSLLNQSEKEISDKTDSENRSEVNKFYSENFGSSPLSKEIAPLEVFDNGRFTYLKFDRHTDFPAVYRVSENEEETLLNSHIKGDWLVVHGVYRELRLRAGQAVVGIYNETYSGGGAPNDSGVSVPGLKRELVKEVN